VTHDSAEQISLLTADGLTLDGDLQVPPTPIAAAVVCHPHPAYGGDRHNVVVDALFRTLAASGVAALRFDFRRSDRDPRAEGVAERADVVAAVHRLAAVVDLDVPIYLVGYSFGADVALAVGDDRHAGWAVVAPPFRFSAPARPRAGDDRPVLVVAAEHDQFAPPSWVGRETAGWPALTVEVAPRADHFLAGAAGDVAGTVADWVVARAGERRATAG
jgi:alpha/beta superfamily hydrolase